MGKESDSLVSTIYFKSQEGKKVSKAKIRHVWHQLHPNEPLPEINAGIVPKDDFFSFQSQIRKHHTKCGLPNYIETCSIREWGEVVEGYAFVVKSEHGYVVLIRSDSPHSLEEDLRHELTHIHDGDAEPRIL